MASRCQTRALVEKSVGRTERNAPAVREGEDLTESGLASNERRNILAVRQDHLKLFSPFPCQSCS